MDNISFSPAFEKFEDKDQLLVVCGGAIERITSHAPSDGLIQMKLDFDGNYFSVRVELISQQLMLEFEARASSPFIALEDVQKASLEKIKKWSVSRKLKVA